MQPVLSSAEVLMLSDYVLDVDILTPAQWSTLTVEDFTQYRIIVLGDPNSTDISSISAAVDNAESWLPLITGNVFLTLSNPVGQGQLEFVRQGLQMALDSETKMGLYVSFSQYYSTAPSGTVVSLLSPFGLFTVRGQSCSSQNVHVVANHPVWEGNLKDSSFAAWTCRATAVFGTYPETFLPITIASDFQSNRRFLRGLIETFPDGSSGEPITLGMSTLLSPVLCGNGILDLNEECDDHNLVPNDGCSPQCTIEQGFIPK